MKDLTRKKLMQVTRACWYRFANGELGKIASAMGLDVEKPSPLRTDFIAVVGKEIQDLFHALACSRMDLEACRSYVKHLEGELACPPGRTSTKKPRRTTKPRSAASSS